MDLHEGTHLGLCLPTTNNNLEGTDNRVPLFPVAHCILSSDETRPPLHWSKSNRKPRAKAETEFDPFRRKTPPPTTPNQPEVELGTVRLGASGPFHRERPNQWLPEGFISYPPPERRFFGLVFWVMTTSKEGLFKPVHKSAIVSEKCRCLEWRSYDSQW